MVATIMAGLRSVRSAFVAGALILGSLYVIIRGDDGSKIELRKSAKALLDLHPNALLFLLAGVCLLVGSLYVTALEGLVDWVHRHFAGTARGQIDGRFKRALLGPFLPLSESSRKRLLQEATSFYRDLVNPQLPSDQPSTTNPTVDEFSVQVVADVLWMEGKLAGSPLRDTYDEYRAEGESRLSLGLLLPLGAFATGYAMKLDDIWIVVFLTASFAISIQLCNYGLYYYRRAHSLLAHHVADGTLLTPSMETLKRLNRPGSGHDESKAR
jgi:hypothetical protein